MEDTDVFEILKQVGDGLALVISEDGLVQSITGFACAACQIKCCWVWHGGGRDGVPPQHAEHATPMATVR